MKYLSQLYKYIFCSRRKMSSSKLHLWEKTMFVNSISVPDEECKLMICMPMRNLKKKINMCRSSSDTIQVLIHRLIIKLNQFYGKKNPGNSSFVKNISFKIDGTLVPTDSICREVFKENTNIILQVQNDVFNVVVNAPMVHDLRLGKPPYKGLMLYPYAFDKGYNVSILDSEYLWYRIDSKNVTEVGNEIVYVPTANDVNCRLKLVCNPCNGQGKFGPTAEIESLIVLDNIIETFPFEKRLEKKPCNSIRVVSYNILADEYSKTKEAKNEMFPYCTPEILALSYRNPLILKELMAYNPDILCLQEVELNMFNRELSPLLKKYMNMSGVFFKKRIRHEGLSCFYSCDKYNLLNTFNIKLSDLPTVAMYCGTIIQDILSDDLWKQALEKQTILQVLILELISDTNNLFLVCNTHLISDPEGDPIRLLQALVELTIINQIKQNLMNDNPVRKVSIIFCGDFNSTPESGVYDLATLSLLPTEHNDVKILNDLKNNLDPSMFKSAYDVTDVSYSNYTKSFSGLLDYIFFTEKHLELIQVLPMPSHEDVTKHVGLPSVLFPSDHLALVADLKVK